MKYSHKHCRPGGADHRSFPRFGFNLHIDKISPKIRFFSSLLGEVPKEREARAASRDSDAAGASLPKLGLSIAPAGEIAGSGSEGVVVTEVDPDGLASEHGLKSGAVATPDRAWRDRA